MGKSRRRLVQRLQREVHPRRDHATDELENLQARPAEIAIQRSALIDQIQTAETARDKAGDALAEAGSSGVAPKAGGPVAPPIAEPAPDSPGRHLISIGGLTEDQCPALVEELALFGVIDSQRFEDDTLHVVLVSDVGTDDIEAVLCFVVDADQISFAAEPPQAAVAPVPPAATMQGPIAAPAEAAAE